MFKLHGTHRIANPRFMTAVRDNAHRTKRTVARRPDQDFPARMPSNNVPLAHLNITAGRKWEFGGVKIRLLASLLCAGAVFTATSAVWFHKGLEIKGVTYAEFMSNPVLSMDFASVVAAGGVGAFVGWTIPQIVAIVCKSSNGQQ